MFFEHQIPRLIELLLTELGLAKECEKAGGKSNSNHGSIKATTSQDDQNGIPGFVNQPFRRGTSQKERTF